MALLKINDGKGGFYMTWSREDVEFINPVEYYRSRTIQVNSDLERELLKTQNPPFPIKDFDDFLYRKAEEEWAKYYEKIKSTNIPKNLILLLESSSKREQVLLLKGVSLTPFELVAFIFYAFEENGFLFSSYRAEHHHIGLDESELPEFISVADGKVSRVGTTNLTDGQLKKVITDRKVIVSKFIDKDAEWHCFFVTYKSLKGEENWKNGQPHFHYISNKFGLSRKQVLEELKSRHYKLNNLPHVSLNGYRDESE